MITYEKKKNIHYIILNYKDNIISYKKYNKMIFECSKWYKNKIKEINKGYESLLYSSNLKKSLHISRKHKNIVIDLMKKVLSYYPIIKTFDFGVFVSNSFARGSNLINSDFDINFVYEKSDLGFQIEEQVSYALTRILNKYRDFIHDSITHRTIKLPEFIKFSKNDKLIFKTLWNNETDEYEISAGNEMLMLKYCYGFRDKKSVKEYLLSFINDDSINEWIYYQKIIFGKKYLSDIFKAIESKELNILKAKNGKSNFNQLIENTKEHFYKELSNYENINFNDMKNFKEYFKNIAFNKIYTAVAILKKNMLYRNCKLNFNDILTCIENKNCDIIFEYFGEIMRFNLICNKCNIAFRTRYNNIISSNFNEQWSSYCKVDNNYISFYKENAKKLYLYLINFIDELKVVNYDNK